VGGIPLCERFGRMFDLAATKSRTIAEMFATGWEARGGVGVEETTVGVGGGVIGGVSDFTSYCDFAGCFSIQVPVAA
jgi:hypothetical protein